MVKPKTVPKEMPAKADNKNALIIEAEADKSKLAEIGLSATTLNAVTASSFTEGVIGEIDLSEAVAVMEEKVSKVGAGDLTGLEATLTAQVTS